jgi:HEAT repeat protein
MISFHKKQLTIMAFFWFFVLVTSSLSLLYAEEDDMKSVYEERKETIAYGIDSEVSAVIDAIIKEKDDRFENELLDLYRSSLNETVKAKIISYFDALDLDSGRDIFFSTLSEEWDQDTSFDLVSAAITYLKKRQTKEITTFFAETLLPDRNDRISTAAVSAIGDSGDSSFSTLLEEELDSSDLSDNKRAELISAIGKLGDTHAVSTLVDLLLDEGEDKSIRWRAASALGEIGGDSSLEALMEVFDSSDPILRSRTTAALTKFDGQQAEQALIQALRDSFWRVRVAAATALGERKSEDAVDILIYKAKSDPDIKNVRSAAVSALGEIGSSKASDLLVELYLDSKVPMEIRSQSLIALLKSDEGKALTAVDSIVKNVTEYERQKVIITETAKILAMTKSDSLEDMYKKMLALTDRQEMVLSALSGIRINKITSLEGEVEKLTGEENNALIRKQALSTLEALRN